VRKEAASVGQSPAPADKTRRCLPELPWPLDACEPLPILSLMASLLSHSRSIRACLPPSSRGARACRAALRRLVLHRTAAHS
jgi:hypothetical protein